jgi:hypothetical protein
MTDNPYQATGTPVETLDTERTIIIDPATGATVTIGARIERVVLDATGRQQREVVHVVAPSADGQQLLYPYQHALYACGSCGAQPLVHAARCAVCGRHTCDACRILAEERTFCPTCGHTPWWARALTWLADL